MLCTIFFYLKVKMRLNPHTVRHLFDCNLHTLNSNFSEQSFTHSVQHSLPPFSVILPRLKKYPI